MKTFLTSFFAEFEYDAYDAEHLLSAYDKITAAPEAHNALNAAISAYRANIKLNYTEEILKRSRRISNLTGIHPYTVDLLMYVCLTSHLKDVYTERGLNMQIYKDSVLDLKWKLTECKVVYGICGSFVAPWFSGFFSMDRFALGRLQFEIVPATFDYDKNGIKIQKDVTKVINVHIPRTGTPMDKESCDSSYAAAREFFKDQVGDNCAFICHSWLLFPENKSILSPKANTYRFMMEYDVIQQGFNEGQDLWRLFDTMEANPDRLPADSSMRRAYVTHLKKGGRVGWGMGIKIK